jgi:hypothetical protein
MDGTDHLQSYRVDLDRESIRGYSPMNGHQMMVAPTLRRIVSESFAIVLSDGKKWRDESAHRRLGHHNPKAIL